MIPVEAIERVIDYLETVKGRYEKQEPYRNLIWAFHAAQAYSTAINELRKVLSDYGPRKS